jgi:hypothetical protein
MFHIMLAVFLAWPAQAHVGLEKETPALIHVLNFKYVKCNLKLYVGSKALSVPVERREGLVYADQGKLKSIHELQDLARYVKIDDAQAALEYVRLRTSPVTWYLWHDSQAVEIIDAAAATALPTFGLRSKIENAPISGFMGILSSGAFKQGKFTEAKVRAGAKEFVVKRWLLTITGAKKNVELVQETVSRTGEYKRVVLQSEVAPRLKDTNWYIMKFE